MSLVNFVDAALKVNYVSSYASPPRDNSSVTINVTVFSCLLRATLLPPFRSLSNYYLNGSPERGEILPIVRFEFSETVCAVFTLISTAPRSINARAQRKTSRNPVSGSQNPGGFIAYENEWVVMQQGSTTSLESVSAVKCTIGWRVRYLSGPGWGERKFRFPPAAFPLKT